ncbi:MAG: BREX system ATP-binding protein BrxD [Candidatus Schekmanbacteria bacterium]|nr:BREX system ATP-binding protein BrxD [Candidatus Schekmanbacteria bacterium]
MISPARREEIISALRRGTVPRRGLETFAVGLARFEAVLGAELETVSRGASAFKAVRGEYGSGKTFFARWLAARAASHGFATSEIQISETETPLHKLETVFRSLMQRLSTAETLDGAFRSIVDGWFYALEEDAIAEGQIADHDQEALLERTNALMESRLAGIARTAPSFSAALRGYRVALLNGDRATADALLAWLAAQPNVAAAAKRFAGIKGDIDHFGALDFLQGLLVVLRDSGYKGLLVVLDEVETLQRVRRDVRDQGLNALRQLIDEVDSGRYPGLYLLMTGTPAFFDGPQGIKRLPPLAQRVHVDFETDARFDNPRAVQIRLSGFSREKLCEVGTRVRDLYAGHSEDPERIVAVVSDAYVAELAAAVLGKLGGKVGIAPRIFLKKLVGDVLDRVDQFDDFDPRRDYPLTIGAEELTVRERAAQVGSVEDVDDIELEIDS